MSTPFLLFDLDGTISNPIAGIWRSINYALEYYGYQSITEEEASKYIGPPLDEIFMSLVLNKKADHINELIAKYRERFSEVGYSENELYPGMEETILSLVNTGLSLGICTSKRKDFADKILKMFHLRDYFEFVSGGDVGVKKHQQIRTLLSQNFIDNNTCMIGDRAVDLIAAHKNGIKSAGVLWGFGSRFELEGQSPEFLLEKPEELKLLV